MPAPRGPRGETVTAVAWVENGAVRVEVYAAAGVRPTKHKSAHDRVLELTAEGKLPVTQSTVKVL